MTQVRCPLSKKNRESLERSHVHTSRGFKLTILPKKFEDPRDSRQILSASAPLLSPDVSSSITRSQTGVSVA